MSTNQKHEISLHEAIEMTTRFRATKPAHLAFCETFEKEAIQKLLNTPGCTLLRVYYGKKENGEVHAILVAADSEDKDILPSGLATSGEEEEEDEEIIIIEDGYRCPTLCPPESPLNT